MDYETFTYWRFIGYFQVYKMASTSSYVKERRKLGKRRYLKESNPAIPKQSMKKWHASEILPYVHSVGVDGDCCNYGESDDISHSECECALEIETPDQHGILVTPVITSDEDDAHSDVSTTDVEDGDRPCFEEVPTSHDG